LPRSDEAQGTHRDDMRNSAVQQRMPDFLAIKKG
jgi:hypothetical protein